MASIHIKEIQQLLADRGEADALPNQPSGFFLEIRFDEPGRSTGVTDPEFVNRILTADCAYGTVTIQFDAEGQLKSIDLS